ncbi:MAG: GntR family transcriptional regulator [Nocardioidaceae bacterium]
MHATKPSASDRAYERVKTGVLTGEFPGGTLLTEGEIAGEVDVSRTPVREAFLRLETEGLIKLYPKKGALVVSVSGPEADSLLEARALVETWAADHAFTQRASLVPELEGLLEQMRAHRAAGDVAAFTEADRGFHEQVVAAAGNAVLARFYRSLRERQLCINAAMMRVDDERMDRAIADHAGLLDALRSGDAASFAAHTRHHLDVARAYSRGSR